MFTEFSVRQAAGIIRHAQRTRSAGAAAVMPFDPADIEDLFTWLRATQAAAGTPPGATASYVTQQLVWAAGAVARKAARQQYRLRGTSAPVVGLGALDAIADKPPWFAGVFEGVEVWAAASADAARSISTAGGGRPGRSLPSVLACLARVTAEVDEAEGDALARRFAVALCSNPLFLNLPVSRAGQAAFSLALLQLRRTGNVRRDLQTAGLTAPRPDVWDEFLDELRTQYGRRAA
jgi:hypothetical protein